jgi:hypothetical protein
MSALGHEQTSHHVRVMSVIPLKADIHQHGLHVRLVPQADKRTFRPAVFTRSATIDLGTQSLRLLVDGRLCSQVATSQTRVSPHDQRRLPERAQEGAPHAIAVAKSRLAGHDIDRVAALFHHQPGGL